ncbi:UDP-glucosyl transferase 88A1 [Actinidia rufa]|uniref:UDP-glucosyl transferase 88A1 n=1 Tax=Actinidia rufa TaxID=165716 RepID=A0A7J0G6L9_9ERIC|nr:UDP-glucosyl transferase 88A1 [Actinidia rufa]
MGVSKTHPLLDVYLSLLLYKSSARSLHQNLVEGQWLAIIPKHIKRQKFEYCVQQHNLIQLPLCRLSSLSFSGHRPPYLHGRAGKTITETLPFSLYQGPHHYSTFQHWLHGSLHKPRIRNHHIHHLPPPPYHLSLQLQLQLQLLSHHETLAFEVLRLNNPYVHQALVSFSKNCTVRALIVDFFCTPALSVAVELKIPAYYFFTSGACVLDSFLYLPTIHRNTTKSLKDLNTNLEFPGLPPIPSADMAKPMLDRNDEAYEGFLNASNHLPKSAGIIVNTFELLEPRAIKTISDGLCVPDEPTPPLYCIGPLIAADNRTSGDGGSHDCLKWLNSQPSQSVVFLCFGSLGLFSADQLNEIAVGLERSGQRFLWVVRSPPAEDQSKWFLTPPEPDLDVLLPQGFLDRTKERGLVVKSWAPQACPMVAWPLYAEQRFNRVVLVEEMKLALPMNESEDGFVSAAEVEKRVRELMDSEQGNSVRMQVLAMKAAAEAAMSEGCSLARSRSLSHTHTIHKVMEAIVLYPSPGIGHLISMVELGKLILSHHPSFSIIILNTTPPFNTGSTAPYIRHISVTTPFITFHHLPAISIPLDPDSYPSMEAITFELLRLNTPNVRHALHSISLTTTIAAFIIDMFCTPALPIGSQLKIPTYYFFTSGAGCLSLLPLSTNNSPKHNQKTSREYECFIEFFSQMPNSEGIIVNTFESLESKALKAISDGLCLPDRRTPPIFCIGPLIASDDHRGGGDGNVHECLKWLDSQPSQSVVFLCFGSLGLFSVEQLKEVAVGLERSGQRFLWVVRSPPTEDKSKIFFPTPDPDLDSLLPDGFLGRIKGRGFVVKSWAPQVEVLKHESVGGFVTHCGWNSVLEAVCAGVPMVAWPLYAEQRLNRVLLVEEMKLALTMNESENEFVMAIEVEKRIRELMESKEGKMVRDRAKAAGDNARAAMSEGGSSLAAVGKLVESMKRH